MDAIDKLGDKHYGSIPILTPEEMERAKAKGLIQFPQDFNTLRYNPAAEKRKP